MTFLGDNLPPLNPVPSEEWDLEGDVLASPVSQRVLAAARARPGLTLSEARDMLGMSWGSLYRHIARLESAGLVRLQTAGRRRLLFPVGETDTTVQPSVMEAAAFLRQPTGRMIATAVILRPGRSVPEIAEALSLTPRVVYHHVQRLLAMNLIASSSETRHRDLTPTPLLLAALEKSTGKSFAAPELRQS